MEVKWSKFFRPCECQGRLIDIQHQAFEATYAATMWKLITCMHGVIWLPLNETFSSVPPIDSTRDFKVSSRRSVSSIASKLNFTWIKNLTFNHQKASFKLASSSEMANLITSSVRWTLYDFLKESQFSEGVGLNSDIPWAT